MSIPSTMRAMVLTGHGGLDRLEYREDWPTPVPAEDEVLVRVGACGLNNTDINTRTGWYTGAVREGATPEAGAQGYGGGEIADGTWSGRPLSFPRIQGADVAGVAVQAGGKADPGLVGQRVMVDPWLLDRDDPSDLAKARYFGSEVDGGFAEYVAVPGSNIHPVRSGLSDAELATFACAWTTAENMLERAGLSDGETAVVTGASGGVGSAAIRLAKLRGARVVAVGDPAKAEALRAIGADAVVDRGAGDLAATVVDAASPGTVDVAADVVGGRLFAPLLDALRHGGRYSSPGSVGGPIVELDLRRLVYKDLRLTGATVVPPGMFARIVRLIEEGKIRPALAKAFPLAHLREAQEFFIAKRFVGNLAVTM